MKKVMMLLLVLLCTFSQVNTGFAAQEDKPLLGRLTKMGVGEEELNTAIKESFFDLTAFSKFHFFDTLNSMLMALNSGTIAGMAVDEYMADYLCSRMDGFVEYQDDAVPTNNLYFSMLLREEDTALCDSISAVIGEMEADGTLDALKAQYIDDVIAGNDPEKVIPEKLENAKTFKVALTGDRPPMDYFSDAGEPIGFNTALVAEIARRLGMNVEFVSIDSGARSIALASNNCDAIFWSEAGDFGNWENADTEDQPENSIVTKPYFTSRVVYIVREDSSLADK